LHAQSTIGLVGCNEASSRIYNSRPTFFSFPGSALSITNILGIGRKRREKKGTAYNGVEGFMGENRYLLLWPVEQVPELNEAYSVTEFAPGLLLIGSDGAEMGYALATRLQPMPVKAVPFIGLSHKEAKTVAPTFEGFFDYLKAK
jgi:hypothetical protein